MKWCIAQSAFAKRWLQIIMVMLIQLPVIAQQTAPLTGTVLNEKGNAISGVRVLAARMAFLDKFLSVDGKKPGSRLALH